ncbi:MAG: NUDIX hydrolase [Bacilli bacterium]|nr:NUDIX hydrolase [Bacilli bacterium]
MDLIKKYYEEYKTINRVKEESGTFLKSETYYITLNNGLIIKREKLLKGNKDGSASIIIPITKEKEILMVIEPRVFTKDTVAINFPAGYIKKDELPIESAKRELLEETGYVSDDWIKIDSYYQDEGCSEAYNYIFLALNCIKKMNQNLDNDEITYPILLNYEEVFELEDMGYIMGANSKLALHKTKKLIERSLK